MLKAIEAYLALRRATGFAMLNAESGLKTPGMSCRQSITSAPARRGARRISTQQHRSIA